MMNLRNDIKISHIIIYSLIVYLLFQITYLLIFFLLDISFFGTANGAYKALNYYQWAHQGGPVEKGNMLYYPLVKIFTALFSAEKPLEVFHCIVYINGFFSSALLAILFGYFFYYFKNIHVAILIVLIHFFIRGNFVLSTNNEDIFPSYAFFVIGTLCYHSYIKNRIFKYFQIAIILFCFSTLLHWTSGIPAFAAVIVHQIFLEKNTFKQKLLHLISILFFVIGIFAIVAFFLKTPMFDVIYPAKEAGSLWVSGFNVEASALALINSMAFIFCGITIAYLADLQNPVLSVLTIASAILTIWLGILVYRSLKSTQNGNAWKNEKSIITFLIIVFIAGTSLNIYEQGTDMQFFIQPIFTLVFLIFIFINNTYDQNKMYLAHALCGILIVSNISFNTYLSGYDKKFFSEYEEVVKNISGVNNTLFVGNPFEYFHIIARLKCETGNEYHVLYLPSEKKEEFMLSDSVYFEKKKQIILDYFSRGYNIVVINFLNTIPMQAGTIFIGYDLSTKMELLQNYIKSNYCVKELPVSGSNKFYVLENRLPDGCFF